MAVLGNNAVLYMGKYNLGGHFRQLDIDGPLDEHDVTTFGNSAHVFKPGNESGTVSAEGFWDGSEDSVDEILGTLKGVRSATAIGPVGDALGSPAYISQVRELSYSIPVARVDVVGVTMNATLDEQWDRGVFLRPMSVATATGNSMAVDNGSSTAFGWAAVLNAPAVTGTTPSMTDKIQHSVDNSVWVDLVTFAALTAAGSEYKSGTGTVNRYVREVRTISGTSPSFEFATAFARRLSA